MIFIGASWVEGDVILRNSNDCALSFQQFRPDQSSSSIGVLKKIVLFSSILSFLGSINVDKLN